MIIGITGTNGSGKGTAVEILKDHGFKHYSARDFITQEIIKRNLQVNRNNMIEVANELRKKHSPAYVIESLYNIAKKEKSNSVIESVRNLSEINFLRKKEDFILLAVDADIKVRYQRSILRNTETDNKSFQEFVEDEKKELKNTDEFKQNLEECKKNADILILNNGSKQDLENKILGVLNGIKKCKT